MSDKPATPDRIAQKAALQQELAQARQKAEAFEAGAVQKLVEVIQDEHFRASILKIQEAAEELITPANKMHVLQLLKGVQGLERMASMVQAKSAQQ